MVNGALTAGSTDAAFVAEVQGRAQALDRSGVMSKFIVTSLLVVSLLAGGVRAATAACGTSLAEFESVIASDAKSGNLNKGVHRRIVAELTGAQAACVAGRDAEALRQLGTIKHRFGYR